MFYTMLAKLQPRREDCILRLSTFLDKHYVSPKRMTKTSFFLFLVPAEEKERSPHDMVLIGADPANQRFLVYDPVRDRDSRWLQQVDVLRPFLADYIDTFGQQSNCKFEASFDND